jgi:hypothetical protein
LQAATAVLQDLERALQRSNDLVHAINAMVGGLAFGREQEVLHRRTIAAREALAQHAKESREVVGRLAGKQRVVILGCFPDIFFGRFWYFFAKRLDRFMVH